MSEKKFSGPIAWMAANPVAANLLMVGILVSGILSAISVPKEVTPNMDLDEITVSVAYPGASPEEVERGILLAVEEAVRGVEHIRRMSSTASEGSGTVTAELVRGADGQKALMDIRNAVDRITSLPAETERPQVSMAQRRRGVVRMVIFGDVDNVQLRTIAEDIREQINNLEGVSSVDIGGVPNYEIRIEVPRDIIRQYGLTLNDIATKIKETAVELPAGGIKDDTGEVLIRMNERRNSALEFADIPVITEGDGHVRKLGEIAKIIDGFDDQDIETKFNGKPSIYLSVYALNSYSPSEVAVTVKDYIEDMQKRLPDTLSIVTWNDEGKRFSGRLRLLMQNLSLGLVLVLIILGLFLEPRLALWVSLGIPISFLGAFLLLPLFGVTFNMMSMFAFIVVLGMVVDDAISIGENIYYLRKKGVPPLEASIEGTKQLAAPIVFSVLTTIVAFAPLLFTPGRMGKWQFAVPVIVIAVLSISLIEALFILPAHLAHTSLKAHGLVRYLNKLSDFVSRHLDKFIAKIYHPLVTHTVKGRWLTVAFGLMIIMITAGMYFGGLIKTIDRPGGDQEQVIAEAKFPLGTPVEVTRALEQRLVASAQEAIEEHAPGAAKGVMSMIGFGHEGDSAGGNTVTVYALLKPAEERAITSKQFARIWQKELGPVIGVETLMFSADHHGLHRPIDFVITHRDNDVLEAASKDVVAALLKFKGVTDADDGVMDGKEQYSYKINKMGADAGLTASGIGHQLRAAYYGAEALRQQRGRGEVKVLVSYPRSERRSLATIDDFILTTPDGGEIPLSMAADKHTGRAYRTISRTDGRRNLRINADIDEAKANAQEVFQEFSAKAMPAIAQKYEGLSYGLRGRQEDMQDFKQFMLIGILLAIVAIYTLIAIPLKSYVQPICVVMAAIPFGIVGAVLAHYFLGMPMSMFSYMGLIALSGVVVNDSILLTTTANDFVAQGMSVYEAAVTAACRRFRPILLTSVTTFFGLAPMILDTSADAQMMIPMAVSLSFGIFASTFFVLLLIPALYVIVGEKRQNWEASREEIV